MNPFVPAVVPASEVERGRCELRADFARRPAFYAAAGVTTLDQVEELVRRTYQEGDVVMNDRYTVTVYSDGPPAEGWPAVTHLSIKRNDRSPIMDWRELQAIKNVLLGVEVEAVQLFPAESRKVDSANQYHMYALPPGRRWPFGFTGRVVTDDTGTSRAKQRPGAEGEEPLRIGFKHGLAVLAAVCLSAGLIACGGGPTAPEAPARARAVLDGWTGAPVEAVLSYSGGSVTAVARGYLPRVAPAAGDLYLWPGAEDYIRPLVYGEFAPGHLLTRRTAALAMRPLPGYQDVQRAVAVEAEAASGLEVAVLEGGDVAVVVDPADRGFVDIPGAAALDYLTFRGNVVVGCRIVMRDEVRPGWFLHEVGHCLGLGHSAVPSDVMGYGERTQFSEAERIALRMMYARRQPGNAPPDVAPGAGVQSSRERTVLVW